MFQVQAFLKNHLNKFSIGTGSGQTIFANGRYGDDVVDSLFTAEQTLSHQQDIVDILSYIGGNDADLDA